jgi:hypothetical protein
MANSQDSESGDGTQLPQTSDGVVDSDEEDEIQRAIKASMETLDDDENRRIMAELEYVDEDLYRRMVAEFNQMPEELEPFDLDESPSIAPESYTGYSDVEDDMEKQEEKEETTEKPPGCVSKQQGQRIPPAEVMTTLSSIAAKEGQPLELDEVCFLI